MRVLVTLVGALAFTASPFPKAGALTSDEGSLLSSVNAERAKYGIAKLSLSGDLVAVARKHSAEMASKGSIYHNSSLTSEVHGWKQIGENVGRGPSATAVHQAFMASSSHRTHILNGKYDRVGIGTVWKGSGSSKTIYVTEIFVDSTGSSPKVVVSQPKVAPKKYVPAAKPKPRPKPEPAPPPVAVPMSVDFLLQLLAMDAAAAPQPAPVQASPALR